MLCSGGRDGAIHLYDTRLRGPEPILSIWGAHTPAPPIKTKTNNKKTASTSTSTSSTRAASGTTTKSTGKRKTQAVGLPTGVTDVLWHPNRESNLITSGAKDGVIKLWDLRMMGGFKNESIASRGQESLVGSTKQDPLNEIDINSLNRFKQEEDSGILEPNEERFLNEFETDKLREREEKQRLQEIEAEKQKNKKRKTSKKSSSTSAAKGKAKASDGKGSKIGTLDNPFTLDPVEESEDISKSKDGWNKR